MDPTSSLDHPVLGCARVMGVALDEVAGVEALFMSTSAKAVALVELARVLARVQELQLRVLAQADDVARETGGRSAAAWLAHETRQDRAAAAAVGRLAVALDARWHAVREGLSAGSVSLEQARVVVAALEELPEDLEPGVLAEAETHLVGQAAEFDPQRLRVLGRKVLEVVAPEVHEDHERKRLEAEEARARQTTALTFRGRGDGTTDIRIRVADAVAGRLKTCLEAYASPRRGHLDPHFDQSDPESGRRVPYAQLLGHAFGALLEAIPGQRLPRHGGSSTTVVVTIPFDRLRARVGAAGLDTGEEISASEAMRLACTAKIVPVVLGGDGQPLHLGRARRLFSDAQRVAMGIRDGHCRAQGCDIPAAWCEAHHADGSWCAGGRTDTEDGLLLCSWHHHRAHDPTYMTNRMPNGDLRFNLRT